MRSTTWIAIAWLSLGCSKAAVMNQSSNDSGAQGKPDAAIDAPVDAAVYVPLQLDARPGEVSHVQEDGACSRSVNLRGVSITRPVPFDVVIVADNSDSLSWSRDNLSAGLKDLLSRVHGHDARFFLLTTTQYGASSQAAVSLNAGKELVSWHDPVSGAAYLHAMTTYAQTCVDSNGASTTCPKPPLQNNETIKVNGTWQFQMPPPIAEITADMDDAAIGAQQKSIADAVLALGGGGSQQEQPICTLLRYIGQSPTALPKHAVFVVLTDEDDTSPPDACVASYEGEQHTYAVATAMPCDSNCSQYQYYTTKRIDQEQLGFTCVPVDDKGTAHPEQATQQSLVTDMTAQCKGESAVACTDGEIKTAGGGCPVGAVVQGCTRSCIVGKNVLYCDLDRTDGNIDLCTQPFDEAGGHYANLADYCTRTKGGAGWGTCYADAVKLVVQDGGVGTSYSEYTKPLVTAASTAGMIQTFKGNADALIGTGNYSIEAIVLDPAFNCPLSPGQSYAPNLRSLASSGSDVFPLCEDYAPALARIASFADYLIQTTFPLDLDDYEAIDSVVVINKQGVRRTVPTTGYNYDRIAKLLRFTTGVLTAQDDSLSVNVARYCEIIIP